MCRLPTTPLGRRGYWTSGTPLPKRGCPGKQRRCGAQVVSLTLGDAHNHSRRCAYFSPAKPLQQQGSPSTTQLFGYVRLKRSILKGLQFHLPGTTAVSGEINCLLPVPAGGPLRQNTGKLGCSIHAVLKVVSTPARLWERSARCFVMKLCVLEQLVAICSVCWRIGVSGFRNLQEKETNRLHHTYCDRFFSHTARLKRHAVEGGLRLEGTNGGQTEVVPSMAARG